MSDKGFDKLDSADAILRLSSPVGMENGVKQVIIRHCGFELYNTRPYHNYETWSDGYLILGTKDGKAKSFDWFLEQYRLPVKDRAELFLIVSAEDLDDAAFKVAKELRQTDKILEWCNRVLSKGTNRALSLRKKFSNVRS